MKNRKWMSLTEVVWFLGLGVVFVLMAFSAIDGLRDYSHAKQLSKDIVGFQVSEVLIEDSDGRDVWLSFSIGEEKRESRFKKGSGSINLLKENLYSYGWTGISKKDLKTGKFIWVFKRDCEE